jgi:hypothetical protein
VQELSAHGLIAATNVSVPAKGHCTNQYRFLWHPWMQTVEDGNFRMVREELIALYAVRDDSNWPVARAYLSETRKIDPAIVDEMHAVGSICANDHWPNPSLVFLHRDPHGKVRGATLRDTKHQSAFRPSLGSKLTAWFTVGNFTNADRVVAVESPIDALSYYSLFAGLAPARPFLTS